MSGSKDITALRAENESLKERVVALEAHHEEGKEHDEEWLSQRIKNEVDSHVANAVASNADAVAAGEGAAIEAAQAAGRAAAEEALKTFLAGFIRRSGNTIAFPVDDGILAIVGTEEGGTRDWELHFRPAE